MILRGKEEILRGVGEGNKVHILGKQRGRTKQEQERESLEQEEDGVGGEDMGMKNNERPECVRCRDGTYCVCKPTVTKYINGNIISSSL